MLSLTKMLTGDMYFGDDLRYTKASYQQKNGVSEGKGPVVAWNYTRKCNLKCQHCYSNSKFQNYDGELNTEEAITLIEELGRFHVPVILFSGGEPLIRDDFFILAEAARKNGIRATLSTNGTLITPELAQKIKDAGVGYVGISVDGMEETNDRFRGVKGAFQKAVEGIRNCTKVGQRVGLRFTINRANYQEIGDVLDLMETENVQRICFYHLVYSGRGEEIMKDDLTHEETRAVMDQIIDRVIDFEKRGLKKEVLMVDNHTDGVYLYLKYRESDPKRAEYIYKLLRLNGGNRSGIAFANIDNQGNVHPDQFLQHYNLGNVRERPFHEIWCDTTNEMLAGLKDRQKLLPETCQNCSWLDLCNGNFRARADAVSGNFWGFDPACYLTDEERAIVPPQI